MALALCVLLLSFINQKEKYPACIVILMNQLVDPLSRFQTSEGDISVMNLMIPFFVMRSSINHLRPVSFMCYYL